MVSSAAIIWIVASYPLFLAPPLGEPSPADAIVVLGGASRERLPEGERLLAEGFAPLLVLSKTGLPGNAAADRLCENPGDLPIVCFSPDPLTTRGEARAIARLARDEGWDDVLVVTSNYHALRSLTHVRQCSSAEVGMVGTEPDVGVLRWLAHAIEETVGLAAAMARPACRSTV
jgi:uncharacterized SAM-binding protein YcdF (DUF218 family)